MRNLKLLDDVVSVFAGEVQLAPDANYISLSNASGWARQDQTTAAFSHKWGQYDKSEEKDRLFQMQREWYLQLYGFGTEDALASFLADRKYIYDAGCGLGYKAAWLAQLAPRSIVIGVDYSDSARIAAESYRNIPNLFFVQGDIAAQMFKPGSIDYVSCDQVIMHTEDPARTFHELARITEPKGGQLACYFYATKALPRELLDEHFRTKCSSMSHDEIMIMAKQLTELGRRLSELKVSVDVPEIPALGIKAGVIDVQRFIYWNFLKCYWNSDLGRDTSDVVNFDWYSPSNAKRYRKEEVFDLVAKAELSIAYFHEEEACYSGRFIKRPGASTSMATGTLD